VDGNRHGKGKKDKGRCIIQAVIFMRDNGSMTRKMDKE
jgi:hypothetical protein